MKINELSVRKFLAAFSVGALLSAAALILALYRLTNNMAVVYCGLLVTAVLSAWAVIFLSFFQKKLARFTDSLCKTLDGMLDGGEWLKADYEAETLLARINHRLDRLYSIMQTGRRRVEEEKAELQSLVSDISHQTKTPVANLKMLNDTLLTRAMPEEKRLEFLQAAGAQLDKLDFLIQAMVKTSRLETGVITLEKKDTPVFDVLAGAINGVLAPIEQKQLALSVDCPQDLSAFCDSRWTSEAIFNLLDNAVKYTPSGGSIRIKVRRWEPYLKIDISDTGRGIPEREHAAIFKRFYREEAVHETDGIGIGLYLARKIITMQGGYIKIASEFRQGRNLLRVPAGAIKGMRQCGNKFWIGILYFFALGIFSQQFSFRICL